MTAAAAAASIDKLAWLTPRTVRKSASQQVLGRDGLARKKRFDSVQNRVRLLLLEEDDEDASCSIVSTPGTAAASSAMTLRMHGWVDGVATPGSCVVAEKSCGESVLSAFGGRQGSASPGISLKDSRMKDPNGFKEWLRSSSACEIPEKTRLELSPATLAGGDARGRPQSSVGLLIMQDVRGVFYIAAKVAGRCVLLDENSLDIGRPDAIFMQANTLFISQLS
jgi:hypothetical protein